MSRATTLSILAAIAVMLLAPSANAVVCIVDSPLLPPGPVPSCSEGYLSPNDVHMLIDGLPAGTTIELDASHNEFFNIMREQGGNLGGETENFDSLLQLTLTGTGELQGFQRILNMQLAVETHIGPRDITAPIQSFDNEMVQLEGEIFGDPDFDLLRIRAGSNLVGPSPGHTVITDLNNGNFNVDSFFDIAYEIEFQGAPGSILDGFAGTTRVDSIRMQAGEPIPEPSSFLLLAMSVIGLGLSRRRR